MKEQFPEGWKWVKLGEVCKLKYGVTEKSIRQDLLMLEKQGWIISGGSTSNRTYQLTELAKKRSANLKNG